MKKQNKKLYKRILASFLIVLLVLTGGVSAYLQMQMNIANTLTSETSGQDLKIDEKFSNNKKTDVSVFVGDTGYSVYVRASIVVNWEKDGKVLGKSPVATEDYLLDISSDGWFYNPYDYYYYHLAPVNSNGSTSILINECKPLKACEVEGYTLNVQILTQTIQAAGLTDDGLPLVTSAWGAAIDDDGDIIKIN